LLGDQGGPTVFPTGVQGVGQGGLDRFAPLLAQVIGQRYDAGPPGLHPTWNLTGPYFAAFCHFFRLLPLVFHVFWECDGVRCRTSLPEGLLDGFSLGSYLLLIDYTSRLLGKSQLLSSYFSADRERLRHLARQHGIHTIDNVASSTA
jgi:hypothetical protein